MSKINLNFLAKNKFFTFLFFIISLFSPLANTASLQSFEDQFVKSTNFMMQNMIRSDVTAGAIIAAPSQQNPDYFYHWVRDAALTLEASLSLYENGYLNLEQQSKMQKFFLSHLKFNQYIQQTSLQAGGLGEPKFSVHGLVYAFPWGRPQNDGPALRSLSLTHLMNIAVKENWSQVESIKKIIYVGLLPNNSLVKSDLEFIAHHWQDLNFDLWEEVYGSHFYTLMAQRKALASGIQTANLFLDFGAAQFYSQKLQEINKELEKFWNPEVNFIYATLQTDNKNKSHLDSAVILAVLHSGLKNSSFSFTDDRVIATFQRLKDNFKTSYVINNNENFGLAFGRYPEDTYDGYVTDSLGNPWVLTTAAAAEYLYRTTVELSQKSSLKINSLNRKFFTDFKPVGRLKIGQTISRKDPAFQRLLQNLVQEGDRYLERILFHRNSDGSLSEQINRNSGYMQGAPNLTWSHASFLTAKIARDQATEIVHNLKGSR